MTRWQDMATLKGRLEVSPLKSWTSENKGSDQRRPWQYYHDHLSGGLTRATHETTSKLDSSGDTGPVKVKGAATSTSQRALDGNRRPRHVKPMTLSQGTLKVRNQASDRSKNHIAVGAITVYFGCHCHCVTVCGEKVTGNFNNPSFL
ncbi:hypothetical protein GUITHDRAFT_122236 [Guillardia theta CCMP2712]|uniref:Uncharacterized protein n=1 Tax=Guillardia theta (strain CCMP2712) TaxID=905079 RepID=L1I5Q7_GUITC|nr:hypothetical protein GUITHDRAFT_122236 [Guillardia theta CCMP2712]EKX31576.1 hypothetical protein GUITHDRAFT_122236 [Guillardia theta CCMP2712]|eukprot:XP_005818556.1 hypothetical protein GUITHDRAFT_122236 [Guillardia theta CCMP2712]